MNKLAPLALGLLLFFGAASWYLAENSINESAKAQISQLGYFYTGQKVSVNTVNINKDQGKGAFSALAIKNPESNLGNDLFIADINFDINLESLNNTPIIVNTLTIDSVDIYLTFDESGDSNIDKILTSIKQALADKNLKNSQHTSRRAKSKETFVRVNSVVITNIRLINKNIHLAPINDSQPMIKQTVIEQITITDFATEQGTEVSQLTANLLKQLLISAKEHSVGVNN